MTVTPLRNHLLLRPRPLPAQSGRIQRVTRESVVYACDVLAVGPEVREVQAGDIVYVNILTATGVGTDVVVPETSVLAKL